jgi:hypothetical protein
MLFIIFAKGSILTIELARIALQNSTLCPLQICGKLWRVDFLDKDKSDLGAQH